VTQVTRTLENAIDLREGLTWPVIWGLHSAETHIDIKSNGDPLKSQLISPKAENTPKINRKWLGSKNNTNKTTLPSF
jgi:hypothetical protein